MALQMIAGNLIGAGIQVDLTTVDDVYVTVDAVVSSDNDVGIVGIGSHHAAIAGLVAGYIAAIRLGDSASLDSGNTVIIESTGHLRGYSVFDQAAVRVMGSESYVENNGKIWGTGSGIGMSGVGSSTQSVIVNRGSIDVEDDGILRFSSNEKLVVVNSGTIRGGFTAFTSIASNIDVIINSGSMIGAVKLGGGNDQYSGAAGSLIGTAFGEAGDDLLIGGSKNDVFDGGTDNDTLTGNGGNDQLLGQAGYDTLSGGPGSDTLNGGTQNDLLNGGVGYDALTGGAHNDVFLFNVPATFANRDTITDFNFGNDTMRLENAVFTALAAGPLHPTKFKLSTQPKDANDFIQYNPATGALVYDSNGSGAGGAVHFATLANKPAISHLDFFVV